MHYLDFIYVIAGAAMLWVGADWIVDSASAIARKFNVSELVIGLTIVALGTSAPEFLVTATAAFKGLEDISLANVVGSNFFNLGIILGLMALIRPIPTHRTILYRDGLMLLAITTLVTVMALDLRLERIEGILLLVMFCGYLGFLLYLGKRMADRAKKVAEMGHAPAPKTAGPIEIPDQGGERAATWKDYPKLALGFAGIAIGSDFLVEGASSIATALGVSSWVIGLTIVAAGTSLPELVTCLAASLKKKNDMLLGNLIGSDFFNFAGVLGLTCLLRPIGVQETSLISMYVLVGATCTVMVFIRSGWSIGRWEGGTLLVFSLFRWGVEFAKGAG